MAYYSEFLFDMSSTDEFPIIATIIIIFFMICEPILLFMSYTNTQTRDILIKGWYSMILSMFISSLGGFILENSVNRFERLATFQPVFSGFAGNCAALQASRISTSLHRSGSTGTIHRDYKICVSPVYVFCSNSK
jgi:solute carrier family 41